MLGWVSSQLTSKATLLALLPRLLRGISLAAINALMAASVRAASLAAVGRPANAARRWRSEGRSLGAARRRLVVAEGGELGVEGGNVDEPKPPPT